MLTLIICLRIVSLGSFSYDMQIEATAQRSEAAIERSEAQSMRSEAQSIRSEAQSIRSEAQSIRSEALATMIEAQTLKTEAKEVREEAEKMQKKALNMIEEGSEILKQAFDVVVRVFAFIDRESSSEACSGIEKKVDSIKEDTAASSAVLTVIAERLNKTDTENPKTGEMLKNITTFQGMIRDRLDRLESVIATLDKKVVDSDEKVLLKLSEVQTSSENLTVIPAQLVKVETALGLIGKNVTDSNTKAVSLEQKLEDKTAFLIRKIETSTNLMETMKVRQQAWMSEIRLISLYKMTHESNRHGQYETGVITDGLVGFSGYDNYMRVYSAKASASDNEKIWIILGGVFRVVKIQVWNARNPHEKIRFQGTRILVDDTYIGTAVGVSFFYDFDVSGDVYGSTVTLHQPRHTDMNVVEVQVWGCGPFNGTDKFA